MESTEKKSIGLNLKATELRLGLPGSESPERDVSLVVCGAKRAFSEAPRSITNQQTPFSPASLLPKPLHHHDNNKPHLSVLATKTQVVGWPPIRSFRKNSMSSQAPHKDDTDADAEAEAKSGCLYVKVSMEGAPYLRKVDLNSFSTYRELSSALEKMFSCFTISSYGVSCRENLSESKLMDLLHGSEYVLTYEDKDGDWMLVGDVPWEMFIDSCKRLRIKKSSEAIGLAPRAMEKCKSHNFHNVICNLSTDP